MKSINIHPASSPACVIHVKYCDTFHSKLKGLMFTKGLPQDHGLMLANNKPSRMDSAIHMFFVNYDIAVLWLDHDWVIVDKTLAKRWRPFYMPKIPAQYVLELHPAMMGAFNVGEKLTRVDIDYS
jgi:uncharacterized protein